ncbi:hypothetical protein BJX66DRAFT_314911 [Aspergillus keveii]|uniref:C2H2-type domain-containing protein n=1 Tax=Aspergillus keveii TaxID=714993 RepID=A0ABR4FQ88_9EURO
MEFQFDTSLSSLTHNAFPDYLEHTFVFEDIPPSLKTKSDHSLASLRHTPYPESPLNGLDPMDAAFPSSTNRRTAGQPTEFNHIHRPSSSHSCLGPRVNEHIPYLREPAALNGPSSPLDRQLQWDEQSTSNSTSYTGEVADLPMNTTPIDGRTLLHGPSQSRSAFRCQWAGCRSFRQFHRVGDLIRHLRTIHISPAAFVCPHCECGKSFGRRDHLTEHVKRRHGG